jgi:hypothetical protein
VRFRAPLPVTVKAENITFANKNGFIEHLVKAYFIGFIGLY